MPNSSTLVTTIRTLAFAQSGMSSWGAAWVPTGDDAVSLACRVGSTAGVVASTLSLGDQSEPWRIEGGDVSLLFTPIGPSGQGGSADMGLGSFDQLCSVSGRLSLDGSEQEINCMGWRASVEGPFELSEIESFRQASGWFEPPQGLSLVALRPRNSRGQDADLVAAALLAPEPAPRVEDPRLSTTYNAAGLPTRVGLELWLESDTSADEDDDVADRHDESDHHFAESDRHDESDRHFDDSDRRDESDHHFPRRAAGEVLGGTIDWEVAGFRLHASLLRWHSRGEDGAGMYLLGQRE